MRNLTSKKPVKAGDFVQLRELIREHTRRLKQDEKLEIVVHPAKETDKLYVNLIGYHEDLLD
jgi:hypothetical protein